MSSFLYQIKGVRLHKSSQRVQGDRCISVRAAVNERHRLNGEGGTAAVVSPPQASVVEQAVTDQALTEAEVTYRQPHSLDDDVLWDRVLDGQEIRQLLKDSDGPARVFTPFVRPPSPSLPVTKLPLLLYLPGVDGTGLAAYRSFPGLARAFDLKALLLPAKSRQDFEELVTTVKDYLEFEASSETEPPGRPVYLMGESLGALLALAVAAEAEYLVDRVIIVNPATNFSESIWSQLTPIISAMPEQAYNNVFPYALMPILTNPTKFVAGLIPQGAGPQEAAGKLLEDLPRLLSQLNVLPEVLPRDTLLWRLGLIRQANVYLETRWLKVKQRTFAILSENDMMLPSGEEEQFLKNNIPRCTVRIMKDHGHALLQEAGVDVVKILMDEGFYTAERRLSSWGPNPQGRVAAAFGRPGPMELPTPKEFYNQRQELQPYAFIRRLQSPVFFSTTEEGQLIKGLGALPKSGPLLFVGNHQILALDLGIFMSEVYQETGRVPRGMTHPMAMTELTTRLYRQEETKEPDVARRMAKRRERAQESNEGFPLDRIFETWGSVRVSAKNLIKLLQLGEPVLLFPGGAKEACKEMDEAYKIYWPERSEFVRIAAKTGATIIPFAAIGCEDNQITLLSGKRVRNIPQIRKSLEEWFDDMPRARTGVNSVEDMWDDMPLLSLNLPTGPPERMYFMFQKPIHLTRDMASDRELTDKIYAEAKEQVEGAIEYLLRRRQDDPYRDFARRLAFETAWRGRKQAPTFDP